MNKDALINWFESRRGKLTYSMYGSRDGSDFTADCSGAVSAALKSAGVNIIGTLASAGLCNHDRHVIHFVTLLYCVLLAKF